MGVHVALQCDGEAELARLCATARLCGRVSGGPNAVVSPCHPGLSPRPLGRPSMPEEQAWSLLRRQNVNNWRNRGTADCTEAVSMALHPQNVLVGQWHHTQLSTGGGGCLP